MNIGIIGTGSIAHIMISEFQRTAIFSCYAVCSRQEQTGRALAQQFGIPKVYTHLEEMLADPELDIVYIATPNSLHFSQAKAVLLAGKHVLCEKPFVPTAAEADELIALAEQKHLLLFEAITTAYHPNYARIRQQLAQIGDVRVVTCTYCQYSSRYQALLDGKNPPVFDPAFCGGALMDINLYNIHFVTGLFGAPQAVHYYANRWPNGVDVSGILVLEYPGFVCQCIGAKDCAGQNGVQILGTEGSIRVEPGSNSCTHLEVCDRRDVLFSFTEDGLPWFYEVQQLAQLFASQDYHACHAALQQSRTVAAVLEAARRDAGLGF